MEGRNVLSGVEVRAIRGCATGCRFAEEKRLVSEGSDLAGSVVGGVCANAVQV